MPREMAWYHKHRTDLLLPLLLRHRLSVRLPLYRVVSQIVRRVIHPVGEKKGLDSCNPQIVKPSAQQTQLHSSPPRGE